MTITVTYDPEKWKLVPVDRGASPKAWDKMILAAVHVFTDINWGPGKKWEGNHSALLRAIISAATTPPTGKTEAEIKAEALEEAAESAINLAITTCADGITCKLIAENFRQLANQYRTKEGE